MPQTLGKYIIFIGIILVATYGAGELLAAVVEPQARLWAGLARSKPYWLAALGCAAASFVNPYFYHLHVHIFRYLTEPYHRQNISEFFSISFQHPVAMYFEPMILLGIAAVFWNFYRKRLVYSILLIGWAHLALFAARNIPVFVILAAPAVAQMLHEILLALEDAPVATWLRRAAKAATEFAAEINEMDRVERVHLVSLAGFALVAALCYAPAPPKKFVAEYDTASYPAKAARFLQGPEFAKGVFTHDEWGDYLIYRLYPKTKVFIDGRSDFYGAAFGKKFLETMNGRYDWETNLNRYGVETVLLPVDASLASTLKESKRWRVIYDDGTAIVFRLADRAWNPGPASLADAQQSLTGNGRGVGVGDQNPKVVESKDLGHDSAITKRRKATT